MTGRFFAVLFMLLLLEAGAYGSFRVIRHLPSYRECTIHYSGNSRLKPYPNDEDETHIILNKVYVRCICSMTVIDKHNGLFAALSMLLMGGFIGLLFIETSNQASLQQKSIELAKHAFNASHRPKLRIQYIDMDPLLNWQNPYGSIVVINIGDTDATLLSIGADIFPRDKFKQEKIPFKVTQDPVRKRAVIMPGQQSEYVFISGTKLPEIAINEIKSGNMELCLIGRIYYLDQNKTKRITNFFRIYNSASDRFLRAAKEDAYADYEYEA